MQQFIDSYKFAGKKAIVRVDFNVPLNENFEITDDTRIRRAMPTLKKVLAEGGSLIIMSHLGRPKKADPKFSLKHIVGRVSECLGVPVQFAEDCMKADAQAAALKPGEALLLENLRYYAEEEGKPRGLAEDASEEEKKAAKKVVKESQKEFVKKLASYADCYINDAFGTAHRAHASTALIAEYFPNDKMFGYLMEGEIKAIDNVLKNAQRPLTAIIGGSKVSSKLAVLKNLVGKVDNLIIGGGMGYTFIKAQGGHIGQSLHEDDLIPDALEIMKEAKERGVNLSLSVATVWASPSTTTRPARFSPSAKFRTSGKAWMPHRNPWKTGRRLSWPPRPCSGTALWAFSNSRTSPRVPCRLQKTWQRPPSWAPTPWWAAETPLQPSPRWVMQTK